MELPPAAGPSSQSSDLSHSAHHKIKSKKGGRHSRKIRSIGFESRIGIRAWWVSQYESAMECKPAKASQSSSTLYMAATSQKLPMDIPSSVTIVFQRSNNTSSTGTTDKEG